MAPISRILAHYHTCSLNSNSNGRRTCITARGRLRIAGPFLAVRFQPSVPRLSFSVYPMDKVELRRAMKIPVASPSLFTKVISLLACLAFLCSCERTTNLKQIADSKSMQIISTDIIDSRKSAIIFRRQVSYIPEVGCYVNQRDQFGDIQREKLISTTAYSHTEKLVDQPVTVLQSRFYEYLLVCVVINDPSILSKYGYMVVNYSDQESIQVLERKEGFIIKKKLDGKDNTDAIDLIIFDSSGNELIKVEDISSQ
jgi:hypothetical protein